MRKANDSARDCASHFPRPSVSAAPQDLVLQQRPPRTSGRHGGKLQMRSGARRRLSVSDFGDEPESAFVLAFLLMKLRLDRHLWG